MTAPDEPKSPKHPGATNPQQSVNPFRLEMLFEDVTQVFRPNRVPTASTPELLISMDTNVLLLPYTIRKDGLKTIQHFYEGLRSAGRLLLSERVAREFIANRDRKLAELIKMIGDLKSRINIGENKISPILEGVDGSHEMLEASEALTSAKKIYIKALEKVSATVEAWSGDDPVTSIYNAVFDADNIISSGESQEQLLEEWNIRRRERIPPGYKDSNKEDTGIGDFLVWKSLLKIGSEYKRDLIFVTGDEKADWFVRSNNQGAYPRPELIAEYRRASEGKNIRFAEFHEVLREMEVAEEIVEEVESAEIYANVAARTKGSRAERQLNCIAHVPLGKTEIIVYQMNYGGGDVSFCSDNVNFTVNLSECSENSIWAYPNGRDELNVIKQGTIGQFIDSRNFNGHNDPFAISRGQMLWARNSSGFTLIARLLDANTPRNGETFLASFIFSIFAPNATIYVP